MLLHKEYLDEARLGLTFVQISLAWPRETPWCIGSYDSSLYSYIYLYIIENTGSNQARGSQESCCSCPGYKLGRDDKT